MAEWGADPESRRSIQRLLFRCVSEYLVDEAGLTAASQGGDLARGVVMMALSHASRGAPGRGLSIRALARSLSMPFETTRRRVHELETSGHALLLGDGRVAAAVGDPAILAAEMARSCQGFRRALGRMARLGLDPETFAPGSPRPGADQAAAEANAYWLILGFRLRTLEEASGPHGSVFDAALTTALIHLNASGITNHPTLALRYAGADTPPPDDLRRPVRPMEVAERLRVPYEVVRRRLREFTERGWCAKVDGGYLFTMARMQQPEVLAAGMAICQRFVQLIPLVAQTGMSLRAPDAT